MRNLARGLIHNFHEDIDKAAFFMRDYVPEPESVIDGAKKGALEILSNFESELEYYTSFRLEKADMQEVGKVLCEYLGKHDPMCKDGKIDTQHGNESLTLQTGVVIASIIGNQKMLRSVAEHNSRIAQYLKLIYKIFVIDPGDEEITEITKHFVKQFPADASVSMNLLERITKNFTDEIERIPEDEDYFTRHIFKTGFCFYPGIGYEVYRLCEEFKKIEEDKSNLY